MRATEDARQSARLLLLERGGGLSAISDIDSAFVEGTAQRMAARELADTARERVAWCELAGVYPAGHEADLSIAYQRERQRKPREVRTAQNQAWLDKPGNREKKNALTRARRAARKAQGLPYQ